MIFKLSHSDISEKKMILEIAKSIGFVQLLITITCIIDECVLIDVKIIHIISIWIFYALE